MALDWTIEEYTGASCTGSDGDLNRTLTLQNTSLTKDNGFVISVSVPGNNYLVIEKDIDYTVVHSATGSVITFLNALWDNMAIRVRYYVLTAYTWKVEHLLGSDGTLTDGDKNRVITLANDQLTTTGGFQVTASGLTLMRELEYTAEHKSSGTEVTFLEKLWDNMNVVIKYYQQPTQNTNAFDTLRTDFQNIVIEHGISATIVRRSLGTDQTGKEITDTMGGIAQQHDPGYNEEYYNIFVQMQSTSLKTRGFKDMGTTIKGEIKAYFFDTYPDAVTGNGELIVQTGDILIDQDLNHWRIEKINSERHFQGFEIFKTGILNKIDLD